MVATASPASEAATAVASGISFGLGEHVSCPFPQLLTPLLPSNTSLNPGTRPDPGSQNCRGHFQPSGWTAQDLPTVKPGLGLLMREPLKQENMQTLHSRGSGYCWIRYDIFVSTIKGTFAASHTLWGEGGRGLCLELRRQSKCSGSFDCLKQPTWKGPFGLIVCFHVLQQAGTSLGPTSCVHRLGSYPDLIRTSPPPKKKLKEEFHKLH